MDNTLAHAPSFKLQASTRMTSFDTNNTFSHTFNMDDTLSRLNLRPKSEGSLTFLAVTFADSDTGPSTILNNPCP